MLIPLLSGCSAKMSKHVEKAFTVAPILLMLMLIVLLPTSSCYSMGAPDAACNAMTPGHQQQAQKVGTKCLEQNFVILVLVSFEQSLPSSADLGIDDNGDDVDGD